jgi:hypothetical protein
MLLKLWKKYLLFQEFLKKFSSDDLKNNRMEERIGSSISAKQIML